MNTAQQRIASSLAGGLLALVAMSVALTLLVFSGSALASFPPVIESGAPVIESESVTGVTEHEATLEAEIKPESGTELTYFVEYGPTTSYGTSAPAPPETIRWATCGLECAGEDETPKRVSINLAGLEAGTTYHYRFIATNDRSQAAGEDGTFTTSTTNSSGNAPVITSLEPDYGPTSGGTRVVIHGEPLEEARSVRFGTVEGKIIAEECGGKCEIMPYRTLVVESPPHEAGTVDVTVETAQGVSVTSPGDEFTYGPSGGPSIESESASNITEHDAMLEAQIDPNGSYTGYWFQIDTNSSYDFTQFDCPFELPGYAQCESIMVGEPLPEGLVEPQPQYIPAGSGDQSVSVDLAGIGATLQPATTYHYRVIASNGGPIVDGPDQTVTTSTAPLGIVGPPATSSIPSGPGDSSSSPGVGVLGAQVGRPAGLKPLTKVQKLAKALKACEKKPKNRRAACEKLARRRYGASGRQARNSSSSRK